MAEPLSWIEVDTAAISSNLSRFRALLSPGTRLMSVVKGGAYGHGMLEVALVAARAGADWLGVFHLGEAVALRKAGLDLPILVLGYVPRSDVEEAVLLEARITVSSLETVEAALAAARRLGRRAFLHIKLETGTHRLGLDGAALEAVLDAIASAPELCLEGAHTHFANIEDTTDHSYALSQRATFEALVARMRARGFEVPIPHTACTAAALLFPETAFAMVRVGIGQYGLWPSKETHLSALERGREPFTLEPAMTWKTRVAQVKWVPKGAYIGYGCTFRTTRETRLAILPVGYANGYDRLLSNRGHVLIRGMRAPIRGRVCMNLTMVDATDIEGVELEDEVVLLGRQGDEVVSAELLASWAGTINYEIVTRVDPGAPRVVIPAARSNEQAGME